MATPTLQVQAAAFAGQPPTERAAGASLLGDEESNVANDDHGDYHEEADSNGGAGRRSFSWPTFIGFLVLTFNCAMAIARSKGDTAAVAFVGFSYADLVALFLCLRMFERAPAGSSRREWLKVAVWVLTALLTFAFSGKVAAVMPPVVAVMVWLVAFATVAGGSVALFVYKEKK